MVLLATIGVGGH